MLVSHEHLCIPSENIEMNEKDNKQTFLFNRYTSLNTNIELMQTSSIIRR